MKHLCFFSLFMLFGNFVFSQDETGEKSFEGLIKFSIEVTGKNGAQSAESRAFLEKKPCKNMDMFFKDGDFIINMFNGNFPTTRLFIADSNKFYVVDPVNQRAFRGDPYTPPSKTPPTAVPTGKTLVVAGVECKEYVVEKPDRTILYYVSDQNRVDLKKFWGKTNAQAAFLTKGLNGRIPLKTISKTSTLITTITATKIERKKLDTAQFRIPAGWRLQGKDYRR